MIGSFFEPDRPWQTSRPLTVYRSRDMCGYKLPFDVALTIKHADEDQLLVLLEAVEAEISARRQS
jgi:hypothetical protein